MIWTGGQSHWWREGLESAGEKEINGDMELYTFRRTYLVGTVIIWVTLLLTLGVTLSGTPAFGTALILLGGGSFWFVVLVPGVLGTVR